MALTDAKIRALKPSDKDFKVSDAGGLFLLVKASGSKSWRVKYRTGGKEKLLVIGDYPAVSLAQARSTRVAAKSELAAGNDPNEAKQEQKRIKLEKEAETFEKQARAYTDKTIKEGKADATLAKTEWLLDMANASFGQKPIAEVTSPMILACIRKVESKGNFETAKRLRAKVGAVFRFAIANGTVQADPTYALRDALIRPKVTPRAAITDPKALGGLMRAIDGFHGQAVTRIALQLLAILTPRPGELRQAFWSEFDLDAAVWSIPAERMKMRRPHNVPLPKQAIELLQQLKVFTGTGSRAFPSLISTAKPMSENTLNTALRRMGISADEMTSHGFRATFSTLANESGLWNPDAIERALAHIETNTVRRAYARGEHWEERVRLAAWWAGFLDGVRAG